MDPTKTYPNESTHNYFECLSPRISWSQKSINGCSLFVMKCCGSVHISQAIPPLEIHLTCASYYHFNIFMILANLIKSSSKQCNCVYDVSFETIALECHTNRAQPHQVALVRNKLSSGLGWCNFQRYYFEVE